MTATAPALTKPAERLAYSATETAKLLSISRRTLDQLAHDKKIVRTKLGRKSLYKLSDIQAFLASLSASERAG